MGNEILISPYFLVVASFIMDNNIISSDDSCDSETRFMKNQLSEFGLDEENLSKEEMNDLLKAFNNSKTTSNEEEITREKSNTKSTTPQEVIPPAKALKRRYVDVVDRRMPWSLFPRSLTDSEKAHTLAVYIKLMSLNSYRQARRSAIFASWPPPLQIVEESTRIQPMRSTRSGRTMPSYSGFDDDSTDFDFVVTKPKRRKTSTSQDTTDGVYTNKVVSLKRKTSKDEPARLAKEPKLTEIGNGTKPKQALFTLIED